MKRYLILLLLSTYISPIFSQTRLKVEVKSAQVFRRGALVTVEGRSNIDIGLFDYVISNLPSDITEDQLNINLKGDVELINFSFKIKEIDLIPKSKEQIITEDSIAILNYLLDSTQNTIYALQKEEELFVKNIKIGGENVGVKAIELEDVAELFNEKIPKIKNAIYKSNIQKTKFEKKLEKLESKLAQLNHDRINNSGELTLSIQSKSKASFVAEVTYPTYNAHYEPKNELRIKSLTEPIQLVNKVVIKQNTGHSWDKIKLVLSNKNLSNITSLPVIEPNYLRFYTPRNTSRSANKKESKPTYESSEEVLMASEMILNENSKGEEINDELNFNFEFSNPVSISNKGTLYTDIKITNIEADFVRIVRPKIDKQTYIVANISNWEQYQFTKSNINIYYKGAYLGSTLLDPISVEDTLKIPITIDQSIIVERKQIEEYSTKKIIGSYKSEEKGFEIKVRNTNKQPVKLIVQDQIPVSTQNQIVVEFQNEYGCIWNKETGLITWQLTLAPSETKTLIFKYTVKYPKDKIINGL